MKGLIPIGAIIILVIAVVTLILLALIPFFLTKKHLVMLLRTEHGYNNARLGLLTLLSTTYKGERNIELLGLYLSGVRKDREFLNHTLEMMKFECYRLCASSKVLAENVTKCEPIYRANATIPLPYNPKKIVEKISLVIG